MQSPPPASSASPAPAPAPPAGDGAPPAAGTGAASAPAPDAGAVAPLELDVPAGLDAADPLLTELKASATKLGLDREKATQVLQLHAKVTKAQDAQLTAWHESWKRASQSDPELGGEGDEGRGRYERSLADARGFLRELGTPALAQVLTAFGLEHNTELKSVFISTE